MSLLHARKGNCNYAGCLHPEPGAAHNQTERAPDAVSGERLYVSGIVQLILKWYRMQTDTRNILFL